VAEEEEVHLLLNGSLKQSLSGVVEHAVTTVLEYCSTNGSNNKSYQLPHTGVPAGGGRGGVSGDGINLNWMH
jgi:hypothetical protein